MLQIFIPHLISLINNLFSLSEVIVNFYHKFQFFVANTRKMKFRFIELLETDFESTKDGYFKFE
jgi:hypothetical protein